MAHNNFDKQKAALPTGSHILQHSPASVNPHSDAARIVRDAVNGLPGLAPGRPLVPSAQKSQPAGLAPGLISAGQSVRKLQKAWEGFQAHASPPSSKSKATPRQGDGHSGSPRSNRHNESPRGLGLESRSTPASALPLESKTLRPSLGVGKVKLGGPVSGVGGKYLSMF